MKKFVRVVLVFMGLGVLWSGLALADPSTVVPAKKPTPKTVATMAMK